MVFILDPSLQLINISIFLSQLPLQLLDLLVISSELFLIAVLYVLPLLDLLVHSPNDIIIPCQMLLRYFVFKSLLSMRALLVQE
jgi:hypothetical protein